MKDYHLKQNFMIGFTVLMPFVLTIMIVLFILDILTDPFMGFVGGFIHYIGLFESHFLFIHSSTLETVSSRLIALGLLIFFVYLLGRLADGLIFTKFFSLFETVINKIPFINKIYRAGQEVSSAFLQPNSVNYTQVVLAPFPSEGSFSIGFISQEDVSLDDGKAGVNVSVYIPATPNPTYGFLMMFKKEELVLVDMKKEDALKFIVSCGVTPTPFQLMKSKKE